MLEVLWRHGALSPADLIAEVRAARAWAPATVKTLLGRLIRKGAVRSERVAGRHLYRPSVSREVYIANEVQRLVDRCFEGRSEALAAYLSGRGPAGET